MRPLLPVVVMALIVCAVHHDALPLDSLLAGELRLEGRIEKIEMGRVTIAANAFVNPNGKRGTITPPKTKIIVLPPKGTPLNLKIGESIFVTGRDGGAGKPLVAREVARLQITAEVPPPPAPIPQPVRPPTGQDLLEFKEGDYPHWKAGNLEVSVEKAGFDHPFHFLPRNFYALEQMPAFYTVLQLRGAALREDVRKRFVIRRLLGPHSEFVQLNGIESKDFPPEAEGNAVRVVYWSSKVDPNWEFVDMDVDTTFGDTSSGKTDAELVLENVPLPGEGEVPLTGEVTSAFGTRYRAVKIKASQNNQWHIIVSHQRPATPRDLQIPSYSYQSTSISGGGGLMNGNAAQGEDEIFLAPSQGEKEIKRITLRFHEESRSMQKRDEVVRQRVRFPLRQLLKQTPPTPPVNPLPVLAQAQTGRVTARAEAQGLSWGKDKIAALLFLKGTPEDAKRGVQWTFQKGSLKFTGQTEDHDIPIWTNDFSYLWHVDATPKAEDETVKLISFAAAPEVTRGDAELQIEGRAILDTSFERTIDIPTGNAVVVAHDDDESTLVLQRVQRFSAPEDLPNFPNWLRGSWPNAGVVLLFKGNSLLGDADFTPRCFDAEDDQGRPLQVGNISEDALYQIDVTRKGNSAPGLYSLVVGEPSPDAKSIRIWLSTNEKSRAVRKQTLQLKDVMLTGAK
ncbi:hypothetical protein IAD21_03694 [Abditibacteriota bacterium]|nr:hypothetical protein IAD21_03694 [Abditibacteriota bacterium]